MTLVVYSNSGSFGQNGFDFSGHFVGALQRGGVRKLKIDVEIALVFVGQETRWNFAGEETGGGGKPDQQDECDCAFANQSSRKRGRTYPCASRKCG